MSNLEWMDLPFTHYTPAEHHARSIMLHCACHPEHPSCGVLHERTAEHWPTYRVTSVAHPTWTNVVLATLPDKHQPIVFRVEELPDGTRVATLPWPPMPAPEPVPPATITPVEIGWRKRVTFNKISEIVGHADAHTVVIRQWPRQKDYHLYYGYDIARRQEQVLWRNLDLRAAKQVAGLILGAATRAEETLLVYDQQQVQGAVLHLLTRGRLPLVRLRIPGREPLTNYPTVMTCVALRDAALAVHSALNLNGYGVTMLATGLGLMRCTTLAHALGAARALQEQSSDWHWTTLDELRADSERYDVFRAAYKAIYMPLHAAGHAERA